MYDEVDLVDEDKPQRDRIPQEDLPHYWLNSS